jgi:hypothetical protein
MGYRISTVVENWQAEYIASGVGAIVDLLEVRNQIAEAKTGALLVGLLLLQSDF